MFNRVSSHFHAVFVWIRSAPPPLPACIRHVTPLCVCVPQYNCQHILPLEEVKLESLEDDAQFRNGWLVRTRTKSFAVYAATAAEKAEWMAHINKCVDDLLKKSESPAGVGAELKWTCAGIKHVFIYV